MIEPAPGAAGQTIGSLEAGDPGLDPGAKVAQLAIDPAALDHVFDRQAAPLALGEDALDQRQIVAELGAPALGRDPGEVGQPFAGLLQRRPGGAGGGDQLTIEPAPVVFAAAVLDRSRVLFGQAPAIAPL